MDSYKERRLNELQNRNVYPHTFPVSISFKTYIKDYSYTEAKSRHKDIVHTLAGRVREKRHSGKNLIFYTVVSNGTTLQFILDRREYSNEFFDQDNIIINRGDNIGVTGFVGKSNSGELSVFATKINLLSPCLHILPKESHGGLVDSELRSKKRYLDLIANSNGRNPFIVRSAVFKSIRSYLDNLDFVEVNTPVVSTNVGGASAKPFITYHNDSKQQMFLRIATELYLKQLVVGGIDRVYELGPQFRNESCDTTHNPEFYSLEFYMAYSDYYDMMRMAEELITSIVRQFYPDMLLNYTTASGAKIDINFQPPYRTIDITEELQLHDINLHELLQLESNTLRSTLDQICIERNISCSPPRTTSRLIDKLIGTYIEPQCISPTFVCNHPLVMSPLAKVHRNYSYLSERFELFVGGMELANAYTELNDPRQQTEQFNNQQLDRNLGDNEAQHIDTSFIEALEYGLPPTGGFGMGVDRLVMFMSNVPSIRDVITFPSA